MIDPVSRPGGFPGTPRVEPNRAATRAVPGEAAASVANAPAIARMRLAQALLGPTDVASREQDRSDATSQTAGTGGPSAGDLHGTAAPATVIAPAADLIARADPAAFRRAHGFGAATDPAPSRHGPGGAPWPAVRWFLPIAALLILVLTWLIVQ